MSGSTLQHFLRTELAPYEGRLAMTWRTALVCALVAMVFMVYQIPLAPIACYLVLFVVKPNSTDSLLMGIGVIVLVGIMIPILVGLAVLSEPIIRLLAGNYGPESVATATPILAYLGIAVIFNSTVLLFNAIMQAHGDVTTPVVNMLIGGVVKVVVNYILVAIPSLNIIGAAIGTIVCYVTITVLDLIAMRRSVTTRPAIFRNVIRPAAAAGIMGAATFFAAALLRSFTDSNTVVCLGALIAAVVVYVIFVVVLRCITYEDCMLLPKGEKIAKILHIKQKT